MNLKLILSGDFSFSKYSSSNLKSALFPYCNWNQHILTNFISNLNVYNDWNVLVSLKKEKIVTTQFRTLRMNIWRTKRRLIDLTSDLCCKIRQNASLIVKLWFWTLKVKILKTKHHSIQLNSDSWLAKFCQIPRRQRWVNF